jgi:hypothetical protein
MAIYDINCSIDFFDSIKNRKAMKSLFTAIIISGIFLLDFYDRISYEPKNMICF